MEKKINAGKKASFAVLLKTFWRMWGLFLVIGLAACTTETHWSAGTVTPGRFYLHKLVIAGKREPMIDGYRCNIRPLFFRQDSVTLEQKAVLGVLFWNKQKGLIAENVKGTLTVEYRLFWTKKCASFVAVPVKVASEEKLLQGSLNAPSPR